MPARRARRSARSCCVRRRDRHRRGVGRLTDGRSLGVRRRSCRRRPAPCRRTLRRRVTARRSCGPFVGPHRRRAARARPDDRAGPTIGLVRRMGNLADRRRCRSCSMPVVLDASRGRCQSWSMPRVVDAGRGRACGRPSESRRYPPTTRMRPGGPTGPGLPPRAAAGRDLARYDRAIRNSRPQSRPRDPFLPLPGPRPAPPSGTARSDFRAYFSGHTTP